MLIDKPYMKDIITRKTLGCLPLPSTSWVGLVLILDAKELKAEHRTPGNQLHKASGGFGCEPELSGRAVFAMCLEDGESARWDRGQFIGVASPELIASVIPSKPAS